MHHGQILFSEDNNIVICHPIGAFNVEGLVLYEPNFVRLLKQLKPGNWALISIYEEFEVSGPEVVEKAKEQLNWCCANGCKYTAFVTHSALQEYYVRQVSEGVPFEYNEIFSDANVAEEALRDQLNRQS